MPYWLSRFDLISYGGNAEDVVLLRAFRDTLNGFFVDVGAADPVGESVTKNLVDLLGWRGINIEPLPEKHERLVAGRPHDVNLQVAISTERGTAAFHRIVAANGLVGGPGLSTLKKDIVDTHLETGWGVETFDVETVPLEDILEQHAQPGFDLLKIDVEGSERDVLTSFDIDRWHPRAFVIEATFPDSTVQTHADWEPILLNAGYQLALFEGLNRFYARADEPELLAALSVPANTTDRYLPAPLATVLGLDPDDPQFDGRTVRGG